MKDETQLVPLRRPRVGRDLRHRRAYLAHILGDVMTALTPERRAVLREFFVRDGPLGISRQDALALLDAADKCDRLVEEVETEKEKVIWGFYEEKLPIYSHYPDICELHDEVTADEVNKLVAGISAVEATARRLVGALQFYANQEIVIGFITDGKIVANDDDGARARQTLDTPEVKALRETGG